MCNSTKYISMEQEWYIINRSSSIKKHNQVEIPFNRKLKATLNIPEASFLWFSFENIIKNNFFGMFPNQGSSPRPRSSSAIDGLPIGPPRKSQSQF